MLIFVHGLCFPEKVSVFKNYILYCPAEPEIYRVMNTGSLKLKVNWCEVNRND